MTDRALALELARVCGAWTVALEDQNFPERLDYNISIAAEKKVPLAIKIHAWHATLPPAPNTPTPDKVRYMPEYFQELGFMAKGLATIKRLAGKHGVRVAAILIDSEQWRYNGDAAHDAALAERYAEARDLCKSAMPEVPVDYVDANGYSDRHRLDEPLDSVSYDLYQPHRPESWGYYLTRLEAASVKAKVTRKVVWVAIGSGFNTPESWKWVTKEYSFDLDFVLARTVKAGGYVPCLYPSPFDPLYPKFLPHFAAYVRGFSDGGIVTGN